MGLCTIQSGKDGSNVIINESIGHDLFAFLREKFPQNKNGLISEDEIDDECKETGWLMETVKESAAKSLSVGFNAAHPVFYMNNVVGHAESEELSLLINGIMNTAWWERAFDGDKSEGDTINGKFLCLRKDSMEHGILMPFKQIVVEEDKLVIDAGGYTFKIDCNSDNGVDFIGHRFDFISIYAVNNEEKLTVSAGDVDLGGSYTWSKEKYDVKDVESLEWFPNDNIEYRIAGDDKPKHVNHLYGAAYMVV